MNALPAEAQRSVTEWLGSGWAARSLAGDASVRAYYRVTAPDGRTWILCYYPPEVRAQLTRFLGAYRAVTGHCRVPEVLHHSDVAVLQHDAGDRTLFDVLHQDREQGLRLYRQAVSLLSEWQQAADPGLNAPFSAAFFEAELDMARDYFVEKLMGADGRALPPLMKLLSNNISHHPYVLCHRDFHGQNIHIVNDMLYVIDYQDLRMGPDTYDLASLLRDRGVASVLGPEEERLVELYARSTAAGPGLRERYFETLLQRSIKILGTFSMQPLVRGRMHYLDFIPATLDSVRRCLEELPAYAPLRDIFPLSFDLAAARERARVSFETRQE